MRKIIKLMTNKLVEEWIKDNKEFLNDYHKICKELLFFKVKWGIDVEFILHDPKKDTRIVKELFKQK